MDKGIFVSEIPESGRIEGLFCVSSKRLLETRHGEPYLAIALLDNTGEVQARVWEAADQASKKFEQGDYIWIKAEAQLFRDTVQLRIFELERIDPDGVDYSLFMPSCPEDPDALWTEFRKHLSCVRDPVLSQLLQEIFRHRRTARAFRTAPAAKRMHHAYLGGLLEHSVSVARLARAVCREYPRLDQDLLLAAALVHDIGKIQEFSYHRPPIDYTDKGRLLGHLVLGIAIVEDFGRELGISLENPRFLALKHLILSHHGQREFGAPVLPMTQEAVTLHLLDDLDAKLNYLKGLSQALPPGDYSWTQYQRPMERYFYLPGPGSEENDKGKEQGSDDHGRIQPLLWPQGSEKE